MKWILEEVFNHWHVSTESHLQKWVGPIFSLSLSHSHSLFGFTLWFFLHTHFSILHCHQMVEPKGPPHFVSQNPFSGCLLQIFYSHHFLQHRHQPVWQSMCWIVSIPTGTATVPLKTHSMTEKGSLGRCHRLPFTAQLGVSFPMRDTGFRERSRQCLWAAGASCMGKWESHKNLAGIS